MKKRLLVAALFAVHAAITARALVEMSYLKLFAFAFSSWPAIQIFSDLTVGMLLVTSWIVRDARASGRRAWPYLLATLAFGSFAPLAYLLLSPRRPGSDGR